MPLTLAVAQERVERCNRELRAAELAAEAAAADIRVARQGPNPTLSLGVSNVNPNAGVGGGALRDKTFDSSLRLEQLVERGGKASLRVEQAEALERAAQADVAEQLRQQRLAMHIAYFEVAAAQERTRLQGEFLALAQESASASSRRYEAGEIPRAELARMQLDAARAASDARQGEADLRRARVDLARILGAEAQADMLEVVAVPVEDEPSVGGAGERPDVIAARGRVAASEAGWQLARSIATRDVTVAFQADRWPVSETNLQGTGTSYGVSISLPLQVRHANEGEVARAAADRESARAALERAQAASVADLRIATQDLRAARERLDRAQREFRPLARQVAEAAEFAYARGASGILDVLDARRSLKAVELDEVSARAEAAKAWARLGAAATTYGE